MKFISKIENRRRKLLVGLVGVGISLLAFVLYVKTLAPTTMYYAQPTLLDSAMLQVQAYVLGITHPTGYPTWTVLTHLFTYLPFGDPAYRTNLASAAYAAVAVLLVYIAGLLLSRRIIAAVVGALAFGFGTTFWSQATIAEVYTLNAVFVALTLVVLLLWRKTQKDKHLLLAAFCMGLAMTNHMTSGLLLPAGALFVVLIDRRKLKEWRLILKGAGTFLLGLTPYLYLPIRAAMEPPMNEADPTSFGRFWYLITGGELQRVLFDFGPTELPQRLELYWEYLAGNYNWVLLAAGLVGFATMILWDRAAAALTGFLFLGWLFHALEYNIFDVELYFIPTYLLLSIWISGGLGIALEEAEALISHLRRVPKRAALATFSAVLLLLPLVGVRETYARNDMSQAYRGRQVIDAVVENAAPGSVILHHRSSLWYMVLVEKRRPDLTIVDPFYFSQRVRYNDSVWPGDMGPEISNLLFGTDDLTGVEAATKAAERGPVYILAQNSANASYFREAGFDIVRVEKGILYELVPPGSKPYTNSAAPSTPGHAGPTGIMSE